jgi:hypothetical protein
MHQLDKLSLGSLILPHCLMLFPASKQTIACAHDQGPWLWPGPAAAGAAIPSPLAALHCSRPPQQWRNQLQTHPTRTSTQQGQQAPLSSQPQQAAQAERAPPAHRMPAVGSGLGPYSSGRVSRCATSCAAHHLPGRPHTRMHIQCTRQLQQGAYSSGRVSRRLTA